MKTSKVSVIIPTYKRPDTLSRSLYSVINSSYKNIEIIVVDDNNPRDQARKQTEKVMEPFIKKYKYIKYIKHSKNKNGSAARNTGIRKSTGNYLMFLDDDDEFLPQKIEMQVLFLDNHDESWGACYTRYIDKSNDKTVSVCYEKKSGNLLKEELARNLFIHAGSNLMVRREVALEIDGFDESFKRNQDVEFLVRVLKKYKLGYVDYVGLIVYIHKKNSSINYFDLTNQYLEKFKPFIEEQDNLSKEAIYKMIALQQIRHAFLKKDFDRLKVIKKTYSINTKDVILYFGHLTYRLLSKKSFGYDMNKLKKGIK